MSVFFFDIIRLIFSSSGYAVFAWDRSKNDYPTIRQENWLALWYRSHFEAVLP